MLSIFLLSLEGHRSGWKWSADLYVLSRGNSFQVCISNKEIASSLMLIFLICASVSCKYFFQI